MDFQKIEDFLRNHWPAAIMVAILTAPTTWAIAAGYYGERVTYLDLKVRDLTITVTERKERVAVLDQAATRKLDRSSMSLTAIELFTPSPPVKAIKGIK